VTADALTKIFKNVAAIVGLAVLVPILCVVAVVVPVLWFIAWGLWAIAREFWGRFQGALGARGHLTILILVVERVALTE